MRSLVFLAALATPSVAFADVSNLQSAFRAKDDGGLTDLLADRVDVQIAVDQPTCAKLAGTLPRDKVGPCLHALAGRFPLLLDEGMVGSELVVVGNHGLALALSTKHGKIVAIGPLAPNAADRKLPTTLNELGINFEPSPKLAAALGDKDARAIHKVCYDEHGTITSRRLVTSSKIPAFDKESTASLAARKTVTPFAPFDTAIAACDVVEMVVVHGEPNGVEGGEVGGVVGGVVGGEMGSRATRGSFRMTTPSVRSPPAASPRSSVRSSCACPSTATSPP